MDFYGDLWCFVETKLHEIPAALQMLNLVEYSPSTVDRVSVPSPIAIDILMVRIGEGQSPHVRTCFLCKS